MARKLTATKMAISTMVDDEAPPGHVARVGVVEGGYEVRPVLHDREALDRRDRHGLQVGEEPEADTGPAAEGEVREPGRAARDWVHGPQLGVHQGQDHDDNPGDDPAQDGGAAYRLGSVERSEQPSGTDDRGFRRPSGADEAHVTFQPSVNRSGRRNDGLRITSHTRSFSGHAPQGGGHPRVGSRVKQVSVAYAVSENIVETRSISEKWPIGVVSITRITFPCPPVNAPYAPGLSFASLRLSVSELPTRDYRPMSVAFQQCRGRGCVYPDEVAETRAQGIGRSGRLPATSGSPRRPARTGPGSGGVAQWRYG